MTRDDLGRAVADAWWKIAVRDGNPANSWLASYDEMDEQDREFCRQLGEAVVRAFLTDDLYVRFLREHGYARTEHGTWLVPQEGGE